MIKNPITKKPPLDETPRNKSGKKKRRETVCEDKRRGLNCHICGSNNIVYEVLGWCEVCGKETFNIALSEFLWRFNWDEIESPCNCNDIEYKEYKLRRRWKKNPRHYDSNKVCLTCNSVEAKTCPNCHGNCWTSPFGEKRCSSCGYRHKGYKKEKS